MQKKYKYIFSVFSFVVIFCVFFTISFALTSDWFYDRSVYRNWSVEGNAWGENIGWLTFSPNSSSKVYVADDGLSGYLYGENIGWISLSCRNTSSCATRDYGVLNDTEGNLSGYAWGENIGWVDFGTSTGSYQVKISSEGTFSDYAYGENIGFINFGIGASSATTTWTPRSLRVECDDGIDNNSDGDIDYPADSNCSSLTDDTESSPSPTRRRTVETITTTTIETATTTASTTETATTTQNTFATTTDIATTTKNHDLNVLVSVEKVSIPVTIPQALKLKDIPVFGSDLKSSFTFISSISSFLFSPLQEKITNVLDKSPELKNYLALTGISREQDFISLSHNPVRLPMSQDSLPTNLFTVNTGTTTLRTFITNDSNYKLIQLVRVDPGTSIVVSLIPISKADITGMWDDEKIHFKLDHNRAVFNFISPSISGKYLLVTPASLLPLSVEVIDGPIIKFITKTESVIWLSKVLGWFGL